MRDTRIAPSQYAQLNLLASPLLQLLLLPLALLRQLPQRLTPVASVRTARHPRHHTLLRVQLLFAFVERDGRAVVRFYDLFHFAVVRGDFGVVAAAEREGDGLGHGFAWGVGS